MEDTVLQHTHYLGWEHSFTTYSLLRVRTQFYNIPRSWHSFTTYPGQDTVLQHTQVRTPFYRIPRSGHSFTTYSLLKVENTVLQHTHYLGLRTQFYNIPRSWHSFTTYPGQDTVLQHTQVLKVDTVLQHTHYLGWRTQFYNILIT